MVNERVGFYVRLPAKQVLQLDQAADSAGMKKQEYVSRLLGDRLAQPARAAAVPPASSAAPLEASILSLAEAAAFLRIDELRLLARAEKGELPGRVFDGEWRFSRDALLEWLAGTDRTASGAGFVNRSAKAKGSQ